MAKKKLTETQIEDAYEVVKGFNTPDARFDVGADKPNFVFEKDFKKEQWSALLEMGAVVKVETIPPPADDETIVFEQIGGDK